MGDEVRIGESTTLDVLNAKRLGLLVDIHDATIHSDQVKGQWIGMRAPDKR